MTQLGPVNIRPLFKLLGIEERSIPFFATFKSGRFSAWSLHATMWDLRLKPAHDFPFKWSQFALSFLSIVRDFPVLSFKVLHPRKPLSSGQTGMMVTLYIAHKTAQADANVYDTVPYSWDDITLLCCALTGH